MLHLRIGQRRPAVRAPVDEAVSPVDQALFIEIDKSCHHRSAAAFVHGEALSAPVTGTSQLSDLLLDRAAVFLFPFPDALQKLLTAEFLFGQYLLLP